MKYEVNILYTAPVMYPDRIWAGWGGGGGCCEPPIDLGQSTGWGPGTSAVFLIQNTSFILNLIISVTLIIQYL